MRRFLATFGVAAILATAVHASTLLFVSEYGTGNLRAFDATSLLPVSLPPGYTPPGGVAGGSDGMVTDASGRLYVNRANGTIQQRTAAGTTFTTFATIPGASDLLDLTRNATHLFASRFGLGLWSIRLSDALVTPISLPAGLGTTDGVRVGPDGRVYAVESSDGDIFAYDTSTATWSMFLASPLVGLASQVEFGADGRVFLSRTIGCQARLYAYNLLVAGDYASGLNPATASLVGSFGSGTATGIRIGPDGRMYANNFNSGEVWISNPLITAFGGSPSLTGLNEPGSLYFAPIPEPGAAALLLATAALLLVTRRRLRP
jgi:outer membrane protein assembly factor BamB